MHFQRLSECIRCARTLLWPKYQRLCRVSYWNIDALYERRYASSIFLAFRSVQTIWLSKLLSLQMTSMQQGCAEWTICNHQIVMFSHNKTRFRNRLMSHFFECVRYLRCNQLNKNYYIRKLSGLWRDTIFPHTLKHTKITDVFGISITFQRDSHQLKPKWNRKKWILYTHKSWIYTHFTLI